MSKINLFELDTECNENSTMEVNGIEQDVVTPADTFENHSEDDSVQDAEEAIVANTEDDKEADKLTNTIITLENIRNNIILAREANKVDIVYCDLVNEQLDSIGKQNNINFNKFDISTEAFKDNAVLTLSTEVSLAEIGSTIVELFKKLIDGIKWIFNKIIGFIKSLFGFGKKVDDKVESTEKKAEETKEKAKEINKKIEEKAKEENKSKEEVKQEAVAEVTEISQTEANAILEQVDSDLKNQTNNKNAELVEEMVDGILDNKVPLIAIHDENIDGIIKTFNDLVNILKNVADSFKGSPKDFSKILEQSKNKELEDDEIYEEIINYVNNNTIKNRLFTQKNKDVTKLIGNSSLVKDQKYARLIGYIRATDINASYINNPYRVKKENKGLLVMYVKPNRYNIKGYFTLIEPINRGKTENTDTITIDKSTFAFLDPNDVKDTLRNIKTMLNYTREHSDVIVDNANKLIKDLDDLTDHRKVEELFNDNKNKKKMVETVRYVRDYYRYLIDTTNNVTKYLIVELNNLTTMINVSVSSANSVMEKTTRILK